MVPSPTLSPLIVVSNMAVFWPSTLFGIFFSLLLHHAHPNLNEGVFLCTRSDRKLFNLSHLRAKTRTPTVLIRKLLFADDAALVTHTEQDQQELVDAFASACCDFGLTIRLKKTQILTQSVAVPPSITIEGQALEVVGEFTYLDSCVTSKNLPRHGNKSPHWESLLHNGGLVKVSLA